MDKDKIIAFAKAIGIVVAVIVFLALLAEILIGIVIVLRIVMSSTNVENQIGSKWISEDGLIEFVVQEDGDGLGVMNVDGEILDIELHLGSSIAHINVYSVNDSKDVLTRKCIESWEEGDQTSTSFTVTVRYTTYYEEGQIIVFNRVE